MRVVTYEDRQYDTIGLKLLIASLVKHAPGLPVDVIFPAATEAFAEWVSPFKQITLHRASQLKPSGYDVKPSVLLQFIDQGESEVVWLDTDIIVTRDFRKLLSQIPADQLVTTEEWFGAPYQGGAYRSKAWGFETGRALPATTNSCVVRVTPHHRDLLVEWIALLSGEGYAEAQRAAWYNRPIHLQGDQEVLAALLESRRFSDIPVRYLKRGRDVAHCFQHQGYIAHQMIANILLFNRPYFVHGQGAKPWRDDDTFRYYLDVSTYTLAAAEYQSALKDRTDWLVPKTVSGKMARRFFRDNPWLTGIPLALIDEAKHQRVLKTLLKQILKRP